MVNKNFAQLFKPTRSNTMHSVIYDEMRAKGSAKPERDVIYIFVIEIRRMQVSLFIPSTIAKRIQRVFRIIGNIRQLIFHSLHG
jgi:hypothetical protein